MIMMVALIEFSNGGDVRIGDILKRILDDVGGIDRTFRW